MRQFRAALLHMELIRVAVSIAAIWRRPISLPCQPTLARGRAGKIRNADARTPLLSCWKFT